MRIVIEINKFDVLLEDFKAFEFSANFSVTKYCCTLRKVFFNRLPR